MCVYLHYTISSPSIGIEVVVSGACPFVVGKLANQSIGNVMVREELGCNGSGYVFIFPRRIRLLTLTLSVLTCRVVSWSISLLICAFYWSKKLWGGNRDAGSFMFGQVEMFGCVGIIGCRIFLRWPTNVPIWDMVGRWAYLFNCIDKAFSDSKWVRVISIVWLLCWTGCWFFVVPLFI